MTLDGVYLVASPLDDEAWDEGARKEWGWARKQARCRAARLCGYGWSSRESRLEWRVHAKAMPTHGLERDPTMPFPAHPRVQTYAQTIPTPRIHALPLPPTPAPHPPSPDSRWRS